MQKRQGRVEPFTRTVGLPRSAWLNGTAAPLLSQEEKTERRFNESQSTGALQCIEPAQELANVVPTGES
jgi:hypothetical protein